jgi:hypothetical protein
MDKARTGWTTWTDLQEIIVKYSLQYKIKGRETEEDIETDGISIPHNAETGYTA